MRLSVLDSLRGIFAIMIVFLHTGMQSNIFYLDFVRNSHIFVEFFFVLSGFVISLSYMGKASQPYAFPTFVIRRIARLWPLHMAVLGGFVLIVLLKAMAAQFGFFYAEVPYTGPEISSFILEHVFLVQTFRNETILWLNAPSWSISAELWAYALFGLICFAPTRLIPWLVALTATISFAILQGIIDPGFARFGGYALFRGIGLFMVGHLTYLLWLRLRHFNLPFASPVEIGMIVLIVVQTSHVHIPVVELLMPLSFAVAILVFTFERGVVSRLLSHNIFRVLGDRSYSIYMIHALVLAIIGLIIRILERTTGLILETPNKMDTGSSLMMIDFGSAWIMDIATILTALLVVWLAGYTYRHIEMKGQAWVNKHILNISKRKQAL